LLGRCDGFANAQLGNKTADPIRLPGCVSISGGAGLELAFRITEARWTETSRSATRKRVLVSGLAPMLLLELPLEMAVWEWRSVLLHGALQPMAGALLIELMFWSLDKVPFTCSYFPGRTSLSILAALYLYGFTSY